MSLGGQKKGIATVTQQIQKLNRSTVQFDLATLHQNWRSTGEARIKLFLGAPRQR